jgi:deoxyribose-phosphate aldolase
VDLARLIDHTLLKPEAAESDIRKLIQEAVAYRFATVCVNGRWVELAVKLLRDARADEGERRVRVCAVVGFPLGASKAAVKSFEAVTAVNDGAREIDMVIPFGVLLDSREQEVQDEIAQVVSAVKHVRTDVLVKVILETAALTEDQAAMGCRAAKAAGADFVKTSTGFHPKGGATPEAVGWLVRYAPGLGVKASGGIRDRATAQAMIAAGATRLGTSSGVAIVRGLASIQGY